MSELPFEVGDVVHVPAHNRGYRAEPITLRVTRIRYDLPICYDAWQWIEGFEVDGDGRDVQWVQVLTRVAYLTVVGEASR